MGPGDSMGWLAFFAVERLEASRHLSGQQGLSDNPGVHYRLVSIVR